MGERDMFKWPEPVRECSHLETIKIDGCPKNGPDHIHIQEHGRRQVKAYLSMWADNHIPPTMERINSSANTDWVIAEGSDLGSVRDQVLQRIEQDGCVVLTGEDESSS